MRYSFTGGTWLGDLLECCGDLISSLLIEGAGRFNIPYSHVGMVRSSLFQCPCALELWLILRIVLDRTGKEFGCEVLPHSNTFLLPLCSCFSRFGQLSLVSCLR